MLKPLREADRSHSSESANGSFSKLLAIWGCLQPLQSVYHRLVSCACDERGPASILQRQIEQIGLMPRAKQKVISEMLAALIKQQQSASD
jgi:hypothetical protein